jgi:hypothetical protein
VLPEAIDQVSHGGKYPIKGREYYYAGRILVQRFTDEPLTQKWFDQVVNQYEAKNGIIKNLHRDPRGYLIEPHSGTTIPLGTSHVLEYQIPTWRFHTVLFVEKKSYEPLFREVKLAELYDMAIILSEGYAVDAAKMILSNIQEGLQVKILCLHDADPYGKNIARTLKQESLRSRAIEIIDIGLNLDECLQMGLEPETFFRKNALPQDLELTDLEREMWEGEISHYERRGGKDKPVFRSKRVELAALAMFPDRFLDYIDRKLEENGCKKKLVPPDDVVQLRAQGERDMHLRSAVGEATREKLQIDQITDAVTGQLLNSVDCSGLPQVLKKWARKLSTDAWDKIVRLTIGQRIGEIDAEIEKAIEEAIKSKI